MQGQPSSPTSQAAPPRASSPTSPRPRERESGPDVGTEVTTWMLSGLPCRIEYPQLEEALRKLGFAGAYDFLRMPGGRNSNLGFGFINLPDPAAAACFAKAFTGYVFEGTESVKVGAVRPARLQGKEANMQSRIEGAAMNDSRFR